MTSERRIFMNQCEKLAVAEYEKHKGRVIFVHEVFAYKDDNRIDFFLDIPVKVRVEATPRSQIIRCIDGDVCPMWYVSVLEDREKLRGITGFFVFGPTYSVDGTIEKEHFFYPEHLPGRIDLTTKIWVAYTSKKIRQVVETTLEEFLNAVHSSFLYRKSNPVIYLSETEARKEIALGNSPALSG
jgi:hypothetical protein